MSVPIPLRVDFDAVQLRGLARKTKDGPQARRLLALAAIYDGATRTEAAKIGGVTLQIIRDWVMRFNARGPDGLIDRKAPGQPSRLNDAHRQAIGRMIESGPIPAVHGVVRWRLVDLAQWICEEFRITVAKQTLSRELRAMGYRKLSARPRHHAQAEGAIEDFKKSFPARLDEIAREKGDRCQRQDRESGSPMKRASARRTRSPAGGPSAAPAQALRAISAPPRPTSSEPSARSRARARPWSCPACNTEAMNLHLAEIAQTVAPGAHAVLLVDQAGWHLSARLVVPANITILPLPPKCPSSIRSRISGSTCATTGSRTASSNPTTISSTTAARPGTSSSIGPGRSCPSDYANGHMGSDQ